MMSFRFLFISTLALLFAPPVTAQEAAVSQEDETPSISVDAGVTLASRFLYRGLNLGQAPQFQPLLTLNVGALQLASWSSHPLARPSDENASGFTGANYREVNFWAQYTIDTGVGTLTPYIQNHYNPNAGPFLDFSEDGNNYVQAQLGFQGDDRSAPFDMMVGVVMLNDPANSVYLEGGYRFTASNLAMRAFVGGVPNRSPFNGVTDDGPHLTNVGLSATKELQITDRFALPLGVTFVANPYSHNAFAAVSVSL